MNGGAGKKDDQFFYLVHLPTSGIEKILQQHNNKITKKQVIVLISNYYVYNCIAKKWNEMR